MNIAIISDIHSNCFALKAVIDDFEKNDIKKVIILGDIFGYYPWAEETYKLLEPYLPSAYCIKGNHDQLLLDNEPPCPVPSYWPAAKLNESDLKTNIPEALDWLNSLPFTMSFELNGKQIKLVHGTPENPSMGRYYPDNENRYEWFPKKNEFLLMGHTHYPLIKNIGESGILFNPGSVGQPRDGNPMPSWGILNVTELKFSFVRSVYDNLHTMQLCENMGWNARSILALNKINKGIL